jgi:hypothetical protein
LTDFIEQIQRRRTCSGDDVRVIIRRDEREAAFRREPTADRFAIFLVTIVGHDVAAVAFGCGYLRGGRVVRHDYGCRDLQQRGRQRDSLRMVAR